MKDKSNDLFPNGRERAMLGWDGGCMTSQPSLVPYEPSNMIKGNYPRVKTRGSSVCDEPSCKDLPLQCTVDGSHWLMQSGPPVALDG